MSTYKKLFQKVIENSNSDVWDNAVLEWEIDDCEEDESLASSCICGKESLRYLFTIKNKENGNTLYPIGSSCIKKFDRDDLRDKANINERMFKLLHMENAYIDFTPELFSKKLLLYLYENRAFDNSYNSFNGENDYEFMLKMFNKRNKSDITIAQKRKIKAIILNSIKPYINRMLENKIRNQSKVK